jgi:hypothetical protein
MTTNTTKPATPLPWTMRATQESSYAAFKIGAPSNRTIAAVLDGNANAAADAAYIVAACNAYPQLVADRQELIAALRELHRCMEWHGQQGHHVAMDAKATYDARALLARLGEG